MDFFQPIVSELHNASASFGVRIAHTISALPLDKTVVNAGATSISREYSGPPEILFFASGS